MVRRIIRAMRDGATADDRDYYGNKRLEPAGQQVPPPAPGPLSQQQSAFVSQMLDLPQLADGLDTGARTACRVFCTILRVRLRGPLPFAGLVPSLPR